MSKKKYTVVYSYKDNENILKEKVMYFDNEDMVISFTKSMKHDTSMKLVGKPTIIIN